MTSYRQDYCFSKLQDEARLPIFREAARIVSAHVTNQKKIERALGYII